MSGISLYFPSILSTNTNPSFREICHIDSIYADMFTTDFIFYTDPSNILFPWTSGATQYYMTLFFIGQSNSTEHGWQICLVKRPNNNYYIGIRYNQHPTATWVEFTDSFYQIDLSKPYMVLFQYHILSNNRPSILNFYVTEYNKKTTPDFSYNILKSINDGFPDIKITGSGSNLSFGSSPENASTNYGLITESTLYNSYQAQSTYMKFMRTWNILIPVTSTALEYSLFNSTNPTYSLYLLNVNNTYVPNNTSNMQYQLYIIGTGLSNVYNYSISRQQLVSQLTTLTSVTLLKLLDGYSYTLNSVQSINENVFNSVACFKDDSTILCLKENKEVYIKIQNIRKGDLVKTLKHGYVKVNMIGKTKIYNPGTTQRGKNRLYVCSPHNYPELTEELVITGCHSILEDHMTEKQREETIEMLGRILVTDGKYRIMACLDERAQPYLEEGVFTIWHIALDNENYYFNYGIYANGLLVETCSKRYLKELSGMTLIE
jgi:hypothetical protein